nr:protein-glutamate methylesterase/protein-glutamine glutaminase [uncultured bacterium]
MKVAQEQRRTDVSNVTLFPGTSKEQAIANDSLVRILLVDDFPLWRRFVIAKFRQNHNMRIVGVSDGLKAVRRTLELQPDVILLDVGLPKINGIEVARRIRKVAPNSKILFLSQGGIDLDVVRVALGEVGHGYVLKSDAEKELFAAVEAVMQGKKFVSRRLASPTFADSVDSSI